MDRKIQIDQFIKHTQVSRETISSLVEYEKKLINYNKNLNLIGKSTINTIWNRHFLDSAQVIDFIDKKCNKIIDIGSGAGFPGIVLGIMAKDKKIPVKIDLIEKSPKKVKFLKSIVSDLKLKINVLEQDVNAQEVKLFADVIVVRAFKPLEIIFNILDKKARNWREVITFLGKNGKIDLLHASKVWDIKYKQSMSITSVDSLILRISELKKRKFE